VGTLLALPLLLVFTLLFASADVVFSKAVTDFIESIDLANLVLRLIYIACFTWLAIGFAHFALAFRSPAIEIPADQMPWAFEAPAHERAAGSRWYWQPLGIAEAAVFLGLLLALFATFVVFQLRYLFLPMEQLGYDFNEITYAEYAREGFFQLLAVSAITLLVLVQSDFLVRRRTRVATWVFNALVIGIVACVAVMLVSSFRRLQIYEFEHSFTHLRLFSHSFVLWIAVVFALFVAMLLLRRRRIFAFGLFLSMVIYLAGLNVLDPDAFIAATNLDHKTRFGKELDARNFRRLSEDATPTIVARLGELSEAERMEIDAILVQQRETLRGQAAKYGWQSWNLAREQARAWLESPAFVPVECVPLPSRACTPPQR
jgi:hypothetical protein